MIIVQQYEAGLEQDQADVAESVVDMAGAGLFLRDPKWCSR